MLLKLNGARLSLAIVPGALTVQARAQAVEKAPGNDDFVLLALMG
jgi:hypothetical protein